MIQRKFLSWILIEDSFIVEIYKFPLKSHNDASAKWSTKLTPSPPPRTIFLSLQQLKCSSDSKFTSSRPTDLHENHVFQFDYNDAFQFEISKLM